jgi:hypothetical protein
MRRLLALVVCFGLLFGCGPYQIRYVQPSKATNNGTSFGVTKMHGHGIGPLLLGGGGFFFIVQSMSPALVDYTGEVDLTTICPAGYDDFSEVTHYFQFGHNALAALISWLAIVNWYQASHAVHTCERAPSTEPSAGDSITRPD